MIHMNFVQIAEFDKEHFFEKLFKSLLLRSHNGDEAET